MILASALMNLAEAATGFHGNDNVDYYPSMSLDEAMCALPIAISDMQCERSVETQKQNEALVESAIEALRYGGSMDTSAITEGVLDTLKSTVKKVFDRIRKFLVSIVNKLKVQIDKIRMNGTQLVNRYGDTVKAKSFNSDCKVNDYNILENKSAETIINNVHKYMAKPEDLRTSIFPTADMNKIYDTVYGKTVEEINTKTNDAISKLSDETAAERRMKLANAITGKSLSGDKWRDELRKDLYGNDRVDIAYGSGGFTAENVIDFLKNPVSLTHMKSDFNALKTACDRDQSQLEKSVEIMGRELTNMVAKESEDERTYTKALTDAANTYTGKILDVVSDTYSILSELGRMVVKFEQARINLATRMFKKMMDFKSAGSTSKTTEDFDASDALFFVEDDM